METHSRCDVAIVGAGIAGLTAAHYCESHGFDVQLIEATDRVGGRIKTDRVDGFLLDHGFQVLLSSYPTAQELLPQNEMGMSAFAPGAWITDAKGTYRIGDPLRQPAKLLPMALSRVGTLRDKWLMYRLTKELQQQSADAVFDGPPQSTMEYLRSYGFSEGIISSFFRPFFGGVFLENGLHTPAGMFRFTFGHFSQGSACLPANGMQDIAHRLANKLQRTTLRFNTRVSHLTPGGEVTLESGETIQARKAILAMHPSLVLPTVAPGAWRHTTTMYFGGSAALPGMQRTIGLDALPESDINNYCRLEEVQPTYAPEGKSLWSVTLREGRSPEPTRVAAGLEALIGAPAGSLYHLRTFTIARALPVVALPQNDLPAEQCLLGDSLYTAGDHLLNGSIEAALRSGLRAAEAVCEALKKGV